jgi:hypothetical protein
MPTGVVPNDARVPDFHGGRVIHLTWPPVGVAALPPIPV